MIACRILAASNCNYASMLLKRSTGLNMDMDTFFSETNIAKLQLLTLPGITATDRTPLFRVLNEQFINAQSLAKHRRLAFAATTVAEREMQLGFLAKAEEKRAALENA
jgi:hypothetical protein